MKEIAQVPGRLGLGDAQDPHDIADAEFVPIHQQPKHLQAGLISQGFKELGFLFHIYLITG
jgi:hypothetical protein